jgi:hypothetical protein
MFPKLGLTGIEGGFHFIDLVNEDKLSNYRNMVEIVLY